MQESVPQMIKLLHVLDDHQVEFIIVGGVCAVLHGLPTITQLELDIVHSREQMNIRRLAKVLEIIEARYRGYPGQVKPDTESLDSTEYHLLITRFGPLDLLGTIEKGLGYDELIGHSEEIQIETRKFRLLSLEYLIEIKKDSLFEKDRVRMPLLKQMLNEKKKC